MQIKFFQSSYISVGKVKEEETLALQSIKLAGFSLFTTNCPIPLFSFYSYFIFASISFTTVKFTK